MLDKNAAKLWIETRLRRNHQVENFYFFGSFVTDSGKIGDVDIVVIFSAWDQYKFLGSTRQDFANEFGLALHIQSFHVDQRKEINAFLNKASK
ncbi:nucleotidyltransferase domain-containing protein [Mesorhizobium sp.]|uniref:nucleotidyltransferase domain-containing protein n=1 Tax=Mesorhizobium sp. TaxID=1871066 RepID=UPI0011F82155|nr:MAG: hypothetical protein E5Y77_11870 [Mesorhizobium sp.]